MLSCKLHVVSGAVACGILLAASSASADDATAAPATAPATPAPAASGTAAAGTGDANAAAEPGMRFRWGLSAMGGPILYSGASSGGGGLEVRVGAQINNLFGVYAQPVFMVGGGASAGTTGASVSALALYGAGALADVTRADLGYIAAGPEILAGGAGSSSAGTGTASASASSGAFFSIAARAGLVLGPKKPERRKGFQLGVDFRTVFTPGAATLMPFLALGYESF